MKLLPKTDKGDTFIFKLSPGMLMLHKPLSQESPLYRRISRSEADIPSREIARAPRTSSCALHFQPAIP
jgi:hypothetical protein